ncbi:hypothetical protein J7413_15940 [Shimia sp. R10_1]|uniref:hypothetical protein n=1 Tax=Shimia sp. R10_1 TaxID=2821095 RepID=UPI001ADAC39F|nr:hypothetical protein [Shimia sp. R10_1]MBO9475040.1 hypothetical protein [Shimia sp. R10_1]
MSKTHLSVWVLPRGAGRKSARSERIRTRAGAFIVASCKDAEQALLPPPSGNLNRRIWPHTSPNGPTLKIRA